MVLGGWGAFVGEIREKIKKTIEKNANRGKTRDNELYDRLSRSLKGQEMNLKKV